MRDADFHPTNRLRPGFPAVKTGAGVSADRTPAGVLPPRRMRALWTGADMIAKAGWVGCQADPRLPFPRRKVIQIERIALDVVTGGQVIQSLDHAIHADEAPGCRLRLWQCR